MNAVAAVCFGRPAFIYPRGADGAFDVVAAPQPHWLFPRRVSVRLR